MTITWNIVNQTGEPLKPATEQRLRRSIARLERHLAHFPKDAVHLQVLLASPRKDASQPVTVNLRVPSDVLQVRKVAPTVDAGVNEAVAVLTRRLERLKARYRRAHAWKGRRAVERPEVRSPFTETPSTEAPAAPQDVREMVEEVLRHDYARLLGFVRRQLNEYIAWGEVSRGAVDPRDLVGRVAEHVLASPDSKPASMDYYTWCTSLAFREVRDAVRRAIEEAGRQLPLDLEVDPDPNDTVWEGVEPEAFALNLLYHRFEPDDLTLADTLADPDAERQDVQVFEREVVSGMRRMVQGWPRLERQIFEMYFLEGLSTDDLAIALECDRSTVERLLAVIRARLRTRLTEAAKGYEPDPSADAPGDAAGSPEAVAGRAALDPERASQRDGAMRRTRLELDALTVAMRRLESSLAAAAPRRERAWIVRVRDDFRAVQQALVRHGESANSPEGLYTEIRRASPEANPRIATLLARQNEMTALAGRLRATIDHDEGPSDFAEIRRQAADLLLMIRQQHAEEVDLVYEAFWQDLGDSD